MLEIDQEAFGRVQDDIKALNEQTEKVELELTKKRNELMLPILEKRREIIAKIPKFWPTVLQNSHEIANLVAMDDLPALEHLTDLWVKHDPKDPRNYEIIFTFSDNEYFTNKELIKKIFHKDGEQATEAYTINWKEGKDLTASKGKKDEDSEDSFFSWFKDVDDVTVGQYFANEVFFDAFSVYAGEDEDMFDDESVDLEDEDEDDGEVDEDDEEDDEDDQPAKKKSRK
ncbi:hypothetical protein BGW38_006118 [Lunasporangiospora selenospora]|uniref:Uncharacterized protein n=1 Tax=Lunasporangiospora selenospora TaxID=979761 RepID=A0A9P6KI39_9FUNG|nr:hypothetical protein BGW38_006118 [Lunasporangiospora selenospora]